MNFNAIFTAIAQQALAQFINKPISVGPINFTAAGHRITLGPIPVQISGVTPAPAAVNTGQAPR